MTTPYDRGELGRRLWGAGESEDFTIQVFASWSSSTPWRERPVVAAQGRHRLDHPSDPVPLPRKV